jgi:hypothetical protein
MIDPWEIDFYSRPIVDEQDKKLWELLVCNSERTFEFQQFCAGSEANARWLQAALTEAITAWQAQFNLDDTAKPEKIRFFRRPMTAIITRACEGIGIPALPSQRAYALSRWLQERTETVYPAHPNFSPQVTPPPTFDHSPPLPLPEALVGDGWAMVSLNFAALAEMAEWEINFRDGIPLALLDLAPETKVPGLVIYSKRAVPLAGWMSGLEIAGIQFESKPIPRLLLETSLSDRWIITPLNKPALQKEAVDFVNAKAAAQQVHFLAVQSGPQDESFAGFWLLQTLMLNLI